MQLLLAKDLTVIVLVVQGMYELYRGPERSVTLKRLVPGLTYTARVKVRSTLFCCLQPQCYQPKRQFPS